MSYTGTEIFNMSIAIINELSDTGTVTDALVSEYKYRAPYLLDLWQKEIAKSGDLYNIVEYENTDSSNVQKWTKFSLPNALKSIKETLFENDDEQISTVNYKIFGKSDIYIYFVETGKMRILYVPIPEKITALTQTLEIDDITSMSGAYYLAESFFRADQNDTAADSARDKFRELKRESMVKEPAGSEEIIDVYAGE